MLQFAFSGLTVGSVYALVALGFVLIYNASDVINFAQGEFVMIGGLSASVLYAAGRRWRSPPRSPLRSRRSSACCWKNWPSSRCGTSRPPP